MSVEQNTIPEVNLPKIDITNKKPSLEQVNALLSGESLKTQKIIESRKELGVSQIQTTEMFGSFDEITTDKCCSIINTTLKQNLMTTANLEEYFNSIS